MCLESWPIETAANRDATRAKITDSGAPPPLNAMPAGIENATTRRMEHRHRERHVIEMPAGDVGVVGQQDVARFDILKLRSA